MQDHPDTGGPEFRPPPPEADRLWRHPSEVRTGGRPHPAARPPRRRSTTAPGTCAAAAALGSLVTIAAVTSAGLLAPIGALLVKDSTTTTAPTPALHMAVVVHVETAAGASEYAGIALHEHDAVVVAAEPGVIGPDSTAWVAQFQGSTQSRSLDATFVGADPQTGAVAFRVPGSTHPRSRSAQRSPAWRSPHPSPAPGEPPSPEVSRRRPPGSKPTAGRCTASSRSRQTPMSRWMPWSPTPPARA